MTVQQQQPNKKDVTISLLQKSSVFIHLDPRRELVVVPEQFRGRPYLVLQVGLNMAVRIPDLEVTDEAISCTLSFNRVPCWCFLPWDAVFAVVAEDERGMVWQEDVPREVAPRFGIQPAPPPVRPAPVAAVPAPAPTLSVALVDGESPPQEPARKVSAAKKKKPSKKSVQPLVEVAKEPEIEPLGVVAEVAPPSKPKRELPPYLRVIK